MKDTNSRSFSRKVMGARNTTFQVVGKISRVGAERNFYSCRRIFVREDLVFDRLRIICTISSNLFFIDVVDFCLEIHCLVFTEQRT